MKNSDDAAALARLVDGATYQRGLDIVERSLVKSRTKSANGRHLIGQVIGTDVRPYVTSVTLKRNAMEHIVDWSATCSCPVGVNCKHGVALVLCDDDAFDASAGPTLRVISGGSAPRSAPAQRHERHGAPLQEQGWAATLEEFLERAPRSDEPDEGEALGLQFEVVTPDGGRNTTPGIVIRPVRQGTNGRWVKGGITWSMIDHRTREVFSSTRAAERNMVAKELLALSRLSAGNRYPSSAQLEVRLEQITSPRLWTLLSDAARAGLALMSDAKGTSIRVDHRTALLTVDVTRRDLGLHVEPRVEIAGSPVDLARSVLIGNPAHGIAWWSEPRRGVGGSVMTLAPLAAPVDDRLRSFLRTAVFDVPKADEKKFLSSFLPELARKVTVASSDGSVDLPESRPPRIILLIEPTGPHQLRLSWSRGVEGSNWREPLWSTPLRDLDQSERDALEHATEILVNTPEMLERTAYGERIRGRAALSGMAAARFMERTVPELDDVQHLVVERAAITATYKEATEAPLVVLEGTTGAQSDWLDLAVVVTVGGEYVSFAALFTALAAGQTTMILPSGTYFSLDTKELRALSAVIAEARSLDDPSRPGMRLSRYQASLFGELAGFEIRGEQVTRWRESLRGLLDATAIEAVEVPATFNATLRPYQVDGYRWLAHLFTYGLGGVLGDDMGLGKTLQALALICHAKQGGEKRPFLVVAPTSVVSNWASETTRFAPHLRQLIVTETAARSGQPVHVRAAGVDLVLTSYALFRLDAALYDEVEWAGAFFDEAQFVKNRTSKGYAAAKALDVAFKVTMSGTPIENNLMELWSLLSIGSPGLFPDPAVFVEYYQKPIEKFANAERLLQFQKRMAPFLLRRTKEEVASDLPDKQEQVLEIELNQKHRRKYQTLLHRERHKVLGLLGDVAKHRFEIFRSLTLLRQASLDISLVDDQATDVSSSKLDALLLMLDEIVADGHRVLVFSQFTRFLKKAKERLDVASITSCYLDGSTTNRAAVIDEFRSGAAPVFLISLKAGGFGLNLTEADYAILLDPWWNPATEAQAVDRIHRIGQTRKVMVYRLVAKDTVEEKVMALKATKSALFDSVLSDGTFASTSIDASDLIDLFDD